MERQLYYYDPKGVRMVSVPLTWQAAESSALFPAMRAELEVAALSTNPPLTQVSLIGTYQPPLGWLGAAGDALIGHRIAQAAVHRFVREIVQRIEAELSERLKG